MKKTHVTFVINDFSGAGAQKLVAHLLTAMDRERFEPSLITLFALSGAADVFHLVPADIDVTRLSFKNVWDLASWRELYRTLTRLRPEVVVSHLFFSNTACRVLKPLLDYRVLATEHNTYIDKPRSHQFIDRMLSYMTYAIIAVSSTVKTFTAQQEGIAPSKFRVIPNGIDISAIGSAVDGLDTEAIKQELGLSGKRLLINVARLTEQKNHSLLLRGFAPFARTHPDTHLLILGEGEKKETLMREAQELGVSEQTHFFGFHKDIHRFYAASDYFVSTSTIEGLSLAYIEALAAGLPILATKTSGTDEMVEEGKNGFFISEHEPAAVTEGLLRMEREDLLAMRRFARDSAGRFDIQTTVQQYEDLILEAAHA